MARNSSEKNLNSGRIAATSARANQIILEKGIDQRQKTFNRGDHNEQRQDDAGSRNEQASRVRRNEAPGR
jgi:hypothetical protein